MAAFPRPAGGPPTESPAARLGDALAFFALAAFFLFLFFASAWIPAARELKDLERQHELVSGEIRVLNQENTRLECRLNALYNDRYFVERVLRMEHGFLSEGEHRLRSTAPEGKR